MHPRLVAREAVERGLFGGRVVLGDMVWLAVWGGVGAGGVAAGLDGLVAAEAAGAAGEEGHFVVEDGFVGGWVGGGVGCYGEGCDLLVNDLEDAAAGDQGSGCWESGGENLEVVFG